MLYLEFLHTFQQVDQGDQVVFKIHQGLEHRFTHRFIGSKMNDPADIRIFLEYRKRVIEIAEINLIVFYFLSRDLFHAQQDIGVGAGVIIHGDHFIAVFQEVHNGM